MNINLKLRTYVIVLTILTLPAMTVFAQDTAKEKEIDRLFDSGYQKIFDKNYAGAVADFKKAVELDPTIGNSHFSLGRAYIENGEPDKGLAEFEKYAEIYTEKDEAAFAWIAEAYLKKGETEKAIEYLSEKIDESENSSVLHETRGKAFAKTGKIDEAIKDYSKAIEYYDAPGLRYSRAELYQQKGDKQLALKDLISIIKKYPDYEKIRTEVVNLGAAEKDLPKKIALQNETPNAKAKELFQKAFDGLMDGGKDAGIYHLGKAAKADPKFAAPLFYIGYIYESQILYGKAMLNYENAQKINPTFLAAFQRQADILRMNGGYDKAILKYNQILRINPKYAPAFLGRGSSYDDQAYEEENKTLKANLEKKALLEYNKAIEIEPQNATVFYRRGSLFTRQNKFDAAIKDLTEALKFNNEDFMTDTFYFARAEALCKSGKKDLAKADEKKATDLGGYTSEPCQ